MFRHQHRVHCVHAWAFRASHSGTCILLLCARSNSADAYSRLPFALVLLDGQMRLPSMGVTAVVMHLSYLPMNRVHAHRYLGCDWIASGANWHWQQLIIGVMGVQVTG